MSTPRRTAAAWRAARSAHEASAGDFGRLTPIATVQSAGLRGPDKKALDAWLDDLAQRGCADLGYRLTGQAVEHLCVKHIRGALRGVATFTSEDTAWLLLVAPHNREPSTDVYEALYRLVEHEPEPGEGR